MDGLPSPSVDNGHEHHRHPHRPFPELFSSISHMVGGALGVIGLVALLVLADGVKELTTVAVYGASLVALFTLSAIYHAFPHASAARPWLRKMDHVGIYLLIAGTYTPVVLLGMPPAWGWSLFGVVWGLAAVGIILKLTVPMAPRWLTAGAYVLMGWLAVVAWPVLLDELSTAAIAWLVAGGVTYTAGAVVYAVNRGKRVWGLDGHDLWHMFVLGGAACHFVLVAKYIL